MTKTIIAVVVTSFLTASPLFGQQPDEDGGLQEFLSDLRACVRSNAAEVYDLGIRATRDAEELFLNRCSKPTLNGLFGRTALDGRATPKLKAMPPGILRRTVRDEWAAFLNEKNSK